MKVTCITVFVKTENIDAFIAATIENHKASSQEEGNLRFDFLQSNDNPARFFLYEAYETDSAAAEHKNTPHYKKWKAAVEPWMAKPREGIAHRVICPTEAEQW